MSTTETTATPRKIRLWKAIEAYRSAGRTEEHWARRDHLDAEIESLIAERDSANQQLRKEQLYVQGLHDALEKLARLGNGYHYGNSTGNMIARAALGVNE